MARDTSGPFAGLPWLGGRIGESERNSGLPGVELTVWARAEALGLVMGRPGTGEAGIPALETGPNTGAEVSGPAMLLTQNTALNTAVLQ